LVRARPRFGRAAARLRSTLVAWLGVVALVAQLAFAAGAPLRAAEAPADAQAAAALGALSALLGPHVALCAHLGESAPGSPAGDSHSCCDDCAFCQLCNPLTALAPPGLAVSFLPSREVGRLRIAVAAIVAEARVAAAAQPRGPPTVA
jgi:hypothetical protein